MPRGIVLASSILGILVFCGCKNTGGVVMNQDTVQITFTAIPANVETDQPVTFTIMTTTTSEAIIQTVIDFEGDGSWDVGQVHGGGNFVVATFTHRYSSAGVRTVRAEVLLGGPRREVRTTIVNVRDPAPSTGTP